MDPHADYRVDPYSYLVISELGEYSISGEPQQIPLGFHVKQFRKFPGLRQFKVSRSGDDSYDIVFVGTMMIQNGLAYISGQTLFCEEPYGYLKRIRFPPFAFKVPDYFGERTTESIIPKLVKEHQEKLMKIIKEELEDITLDGVFDFDIAKRHEFYPPHPTCTTCRARLMVYEDGLCPICDSERRKAHRAVHEIEETGTANTTSTSELVAARDEEGKPVSIVAIMIDKLEKSMKEKAVHEKIDSANTLSTSESDPARAAKGKALMKVGSTKEEYKEAAQAAHFEKKAELRGVRELNASMGRMTSAYTDDLDDNISKKRKRMNANMRS